MGCVVALNKPLTPTFVVVEYASFSMGWVKREPMEGDEVSSGLRTKFWRVLTPISSWDEQPYFGTDDSGSHAVSSDVQIPIFFFRTTAPRISHRCLVNSGNYGTK